jgi:hypothetical protein
MLNKIMIIPIMNNSPFLAIKSHSFIQKQWYQDKR